MVGVVVIMAISYTAYEQYLRQIIKCFITLYGHLVNHGRTLQSLHPTIAPISNQCQIITCVYSIELKIASMAEMKNALDFIPNIQNYLLINVLNKSKKNTFQLFFLPTNIHITLSTILAIQHI